MLQSPSPPSHFISISSQEAGNNLQINCHFYGAEAAGWDSLCPPIKDDVAVEKIKGKFPPPCSLTPPYSVSLVCDVQYLSGCSAGGSGVFSVFRLGQLFSYISQKRARHHASQKQMFLSLCSRPPI